MATRWGICGTGRISNDFCVCLNSLADHKMVAVASSRKEKADSFASDFNIPKTYGTYEELANDPDVEVVYISTLHTKHVELSLLYINAGKHVLCEKPMAMSVEGCHKVLSAAKEKGVLFVEAIWSRFFPAYKFILEHIESGAIGEVQIVQATFTANISTVERISNLDMGGGGLLDLGIYPVQAANLIFKGKPEKIVSEGKTSETGVDMLGMILLKYPGNKFASLCYSTECAYGANSLTIRGTKGCIVIPDQLWCPTRVILKDNEVKYFQLPQVKDSEKICFDNSQGLSYEAQAVRELLQKGLKESQNIPHEDSKTIMYILEEVLKQFGVKYKFL